MIIYTHQNDTLTEYGISNGNFSKIVKGKEFAAAFTTPNVEKFLSWVLEEEIDVDSKNQANEVKMLAIISSWELPKKSFCFRGSFNNDHYKNYLSFINDTSKSYTETFTQCLIPKVKLITINPNQK